MERQEFKIIVITTPYNIDNEADRLQKLLDAGVDYIHVRKPEYDESQVRDLLSSIPLCYRSRLVLHDWYHLAEEYLTGGIHLNSRNHKFSLGSDELDNLRLAMPDLRLSMSAHSLSELDSTENSEFTYSTLSPIFDSISKPGYSSRFDIDSIAHDIAGKRVIALGGVIPDHFTFLSDKNFYGAALLGYVWKRDFTSAFHKLADALKSLK